MQFTDLPITYVLDKINQFFLFLSTLIQAYVPNGNSFLAFLAIWLGALLAMKFFEETLGIGFWIVLALGVIYIIINIR